MKTFDFVEILQDNEQISTAEELTKLLQENKKALLQVCKFLLEDAETLKHIQKLLK